jgi:hypothetical protein
MNDCTNCKVIAEINELSKTVNDHETRLSVNESKVGDMKDDIKEIKESQSKTMWWIIGTLATSLISMSLLIINMLRV